MSAHTPGPHTVEQIGRRPIMKAVAATVLSPAGERLADFRHVADANLFAAAPDLLAALIEAKRLLVIEGYLPLGLTVIDAALSRAVQS